MNPGMGVGSGPVRATMNMGYESSSMSGSNMMSGGKNGNSGFGKYENEQPFYGGGSKESTAYTNSNYRKPFNPSNMQTPTGSSASKAPQGGYPSYSGMRDNGYRNDHSSNSY
jgi:hypothetical protein